MNVYVIIEYRQYTNGVIGVYRTLEEARIAVSRLAGDVLPGWIETVRGSVRVWRLPFPHAQYHIEEWPLLGQEGA